MTKKPSSISADWKRVFKVADHFSQSATFLSAATNQQLQSASGQGEFPYLIPMIVCRALTIELLFKSLILLEKGDAQMSHSLTKLFELLSMTSKMAVEQSFILHVSKSRTLNAMKAQFPSISLTFQDVLKEADRVFVSWRYAFDTKNVGSAYGLGEIEISLRERIKFIQLENAA